MAADHPPDRDEDLELALKLHRELNAVPRRQRQPVRTQAATAALKTLSKKHIRQEVEESSSSESEAGRSQHGSEQKKKRPAAAAAAAKEAGVGAPPSDNDSGSKRKRQKADGWQQQKEGGGATRGKGAAAARGRPGRKPQHVLAAEEARAKAAAAVAAQGDEPRTHVKCFVAGLQYGAWLAVEALASRASLAAAVSKAFEEDGIKCSSETATIVFVSADKESLEFPGKQQQGQQQAKAAAAAGGAQPAQQANGTAGSEQGRKGDSQWEAAAKHAVRVYVR